MRCEPDYGRLHKERQDLCNRRNAAGASPTMPLRNSGKGTAIIEELEDNELKGKAKK